MAIRDDGLREASGLAIATAAPVKVASDRYKRPLDLTILIISHIILAPFLLLIFAAVSFLIWLDDRGPVFFRQRRVGKGGQVFTLVKFRSMVPDAGNLGAGWTSENDARVTRVGKILRRTALDELPQILSVWKGDMSLVGPRALPVRMHEEYTLEEPRFPLRLNGRPGLTGMAQVYLPRHCNPNQRLPYDLSYLERANLWLDVKMISLSAWLTVTFQWERGQRKPQG